MTIKLGYLLPTRERIMEGEHEVAPMLTLAEQAEGMGFDSVWVGDSLLARPRHEPLTLLAGLAGRVGRVELGTAVLLPALRNPVLLAHQAATVDQISEGRLILGVGIAGDVPNIRAEFAAAFLQRNRQYRAERARLNPNAPASERTTLARRWGLSFRLSA